MSVIPHKKGLKFEGFDITETKFGVFSPSITVKKYLRKILLELFSEFQGRLVHMTKSR